MTDMTDVIPGPLATVWVRLRRQLPPVSLAGLHRQGRLHLGWVQPGNEAEAATVLALASDAGVPVIFGALPRWMRGTGVSAASLTPLADGVLLLGYERLDQMGGCDVRRRLVEVQPGVSLAALNRFLRPHGLWVPVQAAAAAGQGLGQLLGRDVELDGTPVASAVPGVSVASGGGGRATPGAGGYSMPGVPSLVDGLLGVDAVLDDGSRQLLGPFGERSPIRLGTGRAGQLVSSLFDIAAGVRTEIATCWPWGRQAAGGYRLDAFHPRPQRPYTVDGSVNLAHLLAGAGGTLAWAGRLHLRLWRRPSCMGGLLLGFGSVAAALADLPPALAQAPTALYLLDGAALQALRASSCADDRRLWQRLLLVGGRTGAERAGMEDTEPRDSMVKGLPQAAWLVLMAGDDEAGMQARLRRLAQVAGARGPGPQPGVTLLDEAWTEGSTAGMGRPGRMAGAPGEAVPCAGAGGPGGRAAAWRYLLGEVPADGGWSLLPGPDMPGLSAGGAGGPIAVGREPALSMAWQLARLRGLARGEPLGLPPLAPATLAAQVAAVEEMLHARGMPLAWRGRLDAGTLQVRLLSGTGTGHGSDAGTGPGEAAARQLLAALAPVQQGYWMPPLQQAFADVRRAFDPKGVLVAGA